MAIFQALLQVLDAVTTTPHKAQRTRPTFPQDVKDLLHRRQRGRCRGCGEAVPARIMTVDHIHPFSQGGTDELKNLQLLCGSCNSTKLDGTPDDLFHRLRAKGVTTARKPRQPAARQRTRKAPDLLDELCTFFGPAKQDPFFGKVNPPKAKAPRKPRQAAAAGAPKRSKPKARPRKPSWEDLWGL